MGDYVHINPPIWGCVPIYPGTPYVGMYPCTLRYPVIRERIPMYLGAPAFGNMLLYTGVAQYVRLYPHTLGYPNIWECIPINYGTRACGDIFLSLR